MKQDEDEDLGLGCLIALLLFFVLGMGFVELAARHPEEAFCLVLGFGVVLLIPSRRGR